MKVTKTNYKFFPGCLARVKLPHLEKSVRTILETVGVRLSDEPNFTCCPDPVVFRSGSRSDWLAIAAHNLTLDRGDPILTLCPGCASSLAEAGSVLKGEGIPEEVRRTLGKSGDLHISEVMHFIRLLVDEDMLVTIKSLMRRDLSALRVGVHYGCHLIRPSHAIGFDDPEKPKSLEQLVTATGAQVVDYEDKMLCCGRPAIDEQTSQAISEHKLNCLKEAGCDLVVVACPFCFEQFDLGQVIIGRKRGKTYDLPVLYVTQLIGLGMGLDTGALGFEFHHVKPHKLLEV